jgi:hypothetical protein
MNYPKIKSASAIDNHILIIEFDNNETKQYDVSQLMEKSIFEPLKDPVLFKAVQVEQGGYAISWNNEIDISEYELWKHGASI